MDVGVPVLVEGLPDHAQRALWPAGERGVDVIAALFGEAL